MNVGLFRSSWTFSNPQPSPQGLPGAGELRADDPNPATDIQELLPSSGQRRSSASMSRVVASAPRRR